MRGEVCEKCDTPTVRKTHTCPQKGKSIWYAWWFRCPSCGWLFMPPEAIRKLGTDVPIWNTKHAKAPKPSLEERKAEKQRIRDEKAAKRLKKAPDEEPRPLAKPAATLDIMWRDEAGQVCRKSMPWRFPCTTQDLTEYINGYLHRVADEDYEPAGYAVPPIPHCARVRSQGKVVAEWRSPR